jgi:hypothetical protein
LFNNSSFFFVQLTLHESSPLIDRFLALEALSSKVRETFVEWNFQHMIVNYPGPSVSKHPEVVAEDVPSKDIDRVMSSTKDRHKCHGEKRQKSRILEFVITLLSELKEVDDSQS